MMRRSSNTISAALPRRKAATPSCESPVRPVRHRLAEAGCARRVAVSAPVVGGAVGDAAAASAGGSCGGGAGWAGSGCAFAVSALAGAVGVSGAGGGGGWGGADRCLARWWRCRLRGCRYRRRRGGRWRRAGCRPDRQRLRRGDRALRRRLVAGRGGIQNVYHHEIAHAPIVDHRPRRQHKLRPAGPAGDAQHVSRHGRRRADRQIGDEFHHDVLPVLGDGVAGSRRQVEHDAAVAVVVTDAHRHWRSGVGEGGGDGKPSEQRRERPARCVRSHSKLASSLSISD